MQERIDDAKPDKEDFFERPANLGKHVLCPGIGTMNVILWMKSSEAPHARVLSRCQSYCESSCGTSLLQNFGCYPAPQEMVFELGLGSTKILTPYLRSLEQRRLISSKEVLGRTYYLVHDPRVGLQHFVAEGTISGEELDAVNELCSDLGQATISSKEVQAAS